MSDKPEISGWGYVLANHQSHLLLQKGSMREFCSQVSDFHLQRTSAIEELKNLIDVKFQDLRSDQKFSDIEAIFQKILQLL